MLAPTTMRRLTRELAKLQRSAPDGIAVQVGEQDMLDIDGWIQGPTGTPYAGGYFRVHFDFQGTAFPAAPPRCTMRTKIFHPNIHANGEICVSTLKKDWSSTYGVEHILLVIKCLLISPNPDSALDPEAARMLQEAYDEYANTASIWTRIHACQRPACMQSPDTSADRITDPQMTATTSKLSTTTVAVASAATAAAKKMEVDLNVDGSDFSSSLVDSNHVSTSPPTAQPLTRSGSTNVNLQKKASFSLPAAPSRSRRLSSTTTLATSAKLNGTAMELVESGLGAAAAAAAATSAAMTAIVTAEMTRISLGGTGGRCGSTEPLSANFAPELMPGSSATWPTRRRSVAVVRRGIKRL